MTKLRILIADDHAVVRAGARALLERQPDCEVCGEAANGHEAVTLAQQLQPDLIVLDITMPRLNGLEAARQILNILPDVQILIFTVHESEQLVREILDVGAHGYVLKSDADHELAAAVEALRRHKPYFTSPVAQIALDNRIKNRTEKLLPGGALTPREREVLQLLVEGNLNKEVAAILGISTKTAESHRTNLMSKLSLRSIAELVHYAIRNKIIAP